MKPSFCRTAIVVFLAVAPWAAFPQETFQGTRAMENVRDLCRPEFQGRKTGLPGARKAAEWIADRFQDWGLKPLDLKGSYIQEYPMIVTDQAKTARMELKNGMFGPVTYQEGNDFTVYFNSGSGRVTAEVVFAGFGISEPSKGRDDYQGIDVEGKVVLIYRGMPQDGKDWSKENERDVKTITAARHKAAGFLMLEDHEWTIRGGTIHEEGYVPGMPAFNVSKKLARDLFRSTGRNIDLVIRDLARKNQSFPLGKTVSMEVRMVPVNPGKGENVAGMLVGSDPVLRHEVIVVGAHMDHNGVSPDKTSYVGADDNASGTAVVMELARVLSLRKDSLKRSVVFVGFGGEEQGLRGSKAFAEHPPVPIDSVCAMFNFDMTGQGDGGGGFGGRNYFPEEIGDMAAALDDSSRMRLVLTRGWGMGGSDHAPFIQRGIPALGFFSTGDHPFYHLLEDTPDLINPASLQFVGDRAFEAIERLAQRPSSLLFEGLRIGRCFVMFGDQVSFYPEDDPRMWDEKRLDSLAIGLDEMGIRSLVLSLRIEPNGVEDPMKIIRNADDFSQWVKKNEKSIVRLRNDQSLNQAAGSGKTAMGLGIEGTVWSGKDPAMVRIVAGLGLDVLTISDGLDPVFENHGLGPFGREVFKTCQEEQVVLDWAVPDTGLTRQALNNFSGKIWLRVPSPEDTLWIDTVKKSTSTSVLWVVTCSEKTRPESLSRFLDRLEGKRVLLKWTGTFSLRNTGSPSVKEEARKFHRLIQDLYDLRKEKHGSENTYKTMVDVLGGHLKTWFR